MSNWLAKSIFIVHHSHRCMSSRNSRECWMMLVECHSRSCLMLGAFPQTLPVDSANFVSDVPFHPRRAQVVRVWCNTAGHDSTLTFGCARKSITTHVVGHCHVMSCLWVRINEITLYQHHDITLPHPNVKQTRPYIALLRGDEPYHNYHCCSSAIGIRLWREYWPSPVFGIYIMSV